jgi:hypothetical protein
MRRRMHTLSILIGLIPATSIVAQGGTGAVAIPAPAQGAWPKATIRQGQYFSWAEPVGWKVNESTNGVDIVNAADSKQAIAVYGLEGTPGSTTTRKNFEWVTGVLKMQHVYVSHVEDRPSQHGFEMAEFFFTFTDQYGTPCQGWAWTSVNNTGGRSNTYGGYAFAPVADWARDAQFMVAMARMVTVSNPVRAFQRDQLIRNNVATGPGSAGGFNHPNTFTPYSNSAAMSRISDVRARSFRDDYPLVDPSTGRTYHGSSDNYDYVRGGWVNPVDRTQLLKVVPPGGN